MLDPKPLYRGIPESAKSLGEFLEKRGVDYFLEDHYEIGVRSRATGLSRQVVFVESNQLSQAELLRDQWSSSSATRAHQLSRRLGMLTVLSLGVPVAWLVSWYLLGNSVPEPQLQWLFLAWIVTLVVLAQIDARRRRSERIDMPRSGAA